MSNPKRAVLAALRDAVRSCGEGGDECPGCYRKCNRPGWCGSTARKCSVVRACVAVGIKVAKPFPDPEIAARVKYQDEERAWRSTWAAMTPEEKAAYLASLGPFCNEGELPSASDGVYFRDPSAATVEEIAAALGGEVTTLPDGSKGVMSPRMPNAESSSIVIGKPKRGKR